MKKLVLRSLLITVSMFSRSHLMSPSHPED